MANGSSCGCSIPMLGRRSKQGAAQGIAWAEMALAGGEGWKGIQLPALEATCCNGAAQGPTGALRGKKLQVSAVFRQEGAVLEGERFCLASNTGCGIGIVTVIKCKPLLHGAVATTSGTHPALQSGMLGFCAPWLKPKKAERRRLSPTQRSLQEEVAALQPSPQQHCNPGESHYLYGCTSPPC